MSFRALLTISLILSASLLGCSVREATPVVHKAPVETEPPHEIPNEAEKNSLATQSVLALSNTDYAAILEKAETGEQIYTKIVAPLAAVLLNKNVYESPTAVGSMTFFRSLREFNTALLKLAKVDPAKLKSSGVLARYKEALYVDCTVELKGTCTNLNTYAREAHFPRVLVLMAKAESDVMEYYRLLYTALERGRPETDQELNYLYLDRHQELAKIFLKETVDEDGIKTVNATSRDLNALRLHARILQNVLAEFDPESVSRAEMDRLMERFNPWDVSRRTGGMEAIGVDKILNWAANGYLYANPQKTALDDSFKARVAAILDGQDENYGLGLRAIFNRIKESDSKGILKNFGLAPDFTPNEYIYLIDRIYYAHFSIEDATTLWNATNKDKKALFKAMNDFVRLQIANQIVWTNGEMNRFFKEKGEAYKDLIQLLRGAVNNSLEMHAMWARTLNRLDSLINFADREYGKVDPFYLPDTDEYKQFTQSVSGLRHNIKMLSVYPNMMMIVYLMAKKNFSATINTWFGPVTITPYEVIKWFFIDVMPPWFNFGTDSSKLSQVELLYAIHFSMVTETFSTFRNNPVIPVNEAEFFQTVVEKLIGDETLKMTDLLKAMQQFDQANSKNLREAMAACSEERTLQAMGPAGETKPRRYMRVFPYEDLDDKLANGLPRSTDTQLGILARFYNAPLNIESNLASMLTGTEARMLFIRNMSGIMKDYLIGTGADIGPIEEAYEKEVSKYRDARAQYLLSVYAKLEQFGDCDKVLYVREKQLRDRLFAQEEQYLDSVYTRVAELNSLFRAGQVETARAKANQYNSDLAPKESGLPKDYVDRGGYDKYEENSEGFYFKYHKLDAFLRLRRNLIALTPNTSVTLPNFDKLPEYQTPSPQGLFPVEESDQAKSRATFISDGMIKFFSFVNVKDSFLPTFMLDRLDTLARLYRLGPIDEKGQTGCIGDTCKQITAEQLIRETLGLIQFIEVKGYDEKIMNYLGTDDLYSDAFWQRIAIDEKRQAVGLMDTTLMRIANDGSRELHSNVSNYFLELTKKYYDTEMSVGSFFFEPRPRVKELIRENYSGYVSEYESKVDEFLAKYEELRTDPSLQIRTFKRTRTISQTIPYEKRQDGADVPVYISKRARDRYTGNITLFHERTSGEFKSEKP